MSVIQFSYSKDLSKKLKISILIKEIADLIKSSGENRENVQLDEEDNKQLKCLLEAEDSEVEFDFNLYGSEITDEELINVFNLIKSNNLKCSFNLGRCDNLSDSVFSLLPDCEFLSLGLSADDMDEGYTTGKITNKTLENLKQIKVKELYLFSCTHITDEGLENLPECTELDLSNCWQITAKGLAHLSQRKTIQTLNLFSCNRVTDDAIDYIKHIPNLTLIDTAMTLSIICQYESDAEMKEMNELANLGKNSPWNTDSDYQFDYRYGAIYTYDDSDSDGSDDSDDESDSDDEYESDDQSGCVVDVPTENNNQMIVLERSFQISSLN